jgi:hypothetical protein
VEHSDALVEHSLYLVRGLDERHRDKRAASRSGAPYPELSGNALSMLRYTRTARRDDPATMIAAYERHNAEVRRDFRRSGCGSGMRVTAGGRSVAHSVCRCRACRFRGSTSAVSGPDNIVNVGKDAYAYGNLYPASKRASSSGSVTRTANAAAVAMACS